MMAAAAVLGLGWWLDRSRSRLLAHLAMPLAVAGLGVAAFHEWLVVSGTLECPRGLLGVGSAPAQSLSAFVALVAGLLTAIALEPSRSGRSGLASVVVAVALGLVLAWASIAGAPPLPPAPAAPYDAVRQPLDTCRPPYVVPKERQG
jgi:hypothetical protein